MIIILEPGSPKQNAIIAVIQYMYSSSCNKSRVTILLYNSMKERCGACTRLAAIYRLCRNTSGLPPSLQQRFTRANSRRSCLNFFPSKIKRVVTYRCKQTEPKVQGLPRSAHAQSAHVHFTTM